ncbi:MAG: hypothetical protein EB828_02385 [Nitrosopumilus sp. D6]|nr:MAG: hypothetical protein EB828_02385 [Nitrosopumilus sp. D6]
MVERITVLFRYTYVAALLTGALLVPAGMLTFADSEDPKTDVDEKMLEKIRGERISKAFMKSNPGYTEEASKSDSGTIYKLAKDDRVVVLRYDQENKRVEKTYSCVDANGNPASYEKRLVKRIKAGCPAVLTDEQVVEDTRKTGAAKAFAKAYPKYEGKMSEADDKYLYTMTYENRQLEVWHDGVEVTYKRFTCFDLNTPVVLEENISKKAMNNCLLNPSYIRYPHGTGIPEGHRASAILDLEAVKAFMATHPFRIDALTDHVDFYRFAMTADGSRLSVQYRDGVGVESMTYLCVLHDPFIVNGKPNDPNFISTIMLGCIPNHDSDGSPKYYASIASSKPTLHSFSGSNSDIPEDHQANFLKKLKTAKAFVEMYPDHVTWFHEGPSGKDMPYYSYTLRSDTASIRMTNFASAYDDDGFTVNMVYICVNSDGAYFIFSGYDAQIKKIVKSAC